MEVDVNIVEPVKKKDGTWDLIERVEKQTIPDLGRHSILCNACGFPSYPKCMKYCQNCKRKS